MCTCISDYGSSEFYDVSYPKARKEYRCYECRTIILPGTLYARHAQKWEGEVHTTKFCVDCDAWSKALMTAQQIACGCSGWSLGELWGEIAEFTEQHIGYDPVTGEKRQTEKEYREQQEATRRCLGLRVQSASYPR
jgi:hypothetical protein